MKLVKILPDKIQIKTDDADFRGVRIKDLLKVWDGDAEIIAAITSITDADASIPLPSEDSPLYDFVDSMKLIECSILGSVEVGLFKNQIDLYPSARANVFPITGDRFSAYIPDVNCGIFLGRYASIDAPAYIDGNKFYQRHSCIVGNTGCGKSETVAKIMEETAKTNCNLVVFDIHGEYGNLSYVDNIRIGDVPFPVWMLGFSDMAANVLKVKEDSTVVMSALSRAYRVQCPNGDMGKPAPFSFYMTLQYLIEANRQEVGTGEFYKTGDKAGQEKTVKGDYNGKLYGIINAMETLYNDKRYSFLFLDFGEKFLADFISRIMGGDKPVKNIDLSGIPHDIAVLIIGAITKLIYNIQITQNDMRPITLVCDEAHVYIPTDFHLTAAQRRMVDIFENIAKEGRKFGITLFVASQRPSELNKTIMAQCANYIVMKLNNENDKSMIKGMMPSGSADVIESTTMFSPGDCLVIGDACPIPLKIHVELANERPQSRTIQFFDEWAKEHRETDYAALVREYLEG